MLWLFKCKKKFACGILPVVVGVATAGLIFQMLYYMPNISDSATRYLLQTSCCCFYLMCFISYYQAINIKNTIPQSLILPRIKHQLDGNHPLYTQKKGCDKQNMRYKPPRTSHCHLCKCVSRMDHHCPYTDGCIGARNYKAFILFCLYGGLFALQFLILSVNFYFDLKDGQKRIQLSQAEVIIWIMLFIISGFLSFSMNGLWISNLIMSCKNVTQLQLLKITFKFQDKNGTHPNPFDIGIFSNLNSIFNGDFWLFWWPSPINHDNDATQFPMRPPITASQLKDLPPHLCQKIKNRQIEVPKSMQELYEKYQSRYQDVIFFYLGKQYKLTPKQIKDQLRKIAQISSKEIEADDHENSQMDLISQSSFIQATDGMTLEQKQILQSLYEDDQNL